MSRSWAICLSLFLFMLSLGLCFFVKGTSFPDDIDNKWVWYHSYTMLFSISVSAVLFIIVIYDIISEGYDGGGCYILYNSLF